MRAGEDDLPCEEVGLSKTAGVVPRRQQEVALRQTAPKGSVAFRELLMSDMRRMHAMQGIEDDLIHGKRRVL